MPLIQISLFPGRSAAQKAEMAQEITRVPDSVAGIPPAATTAIFAEVAPSDWLVAGQAYGAARAD